MFFVIFFAYFNRKTPTFMDKELYNKLAQAYTSKELAEAFIFPHDLSKTEVIVADKELKQLRFQLLQQQTETERIFAGLVRLRFLIEDCL